MHEVGLVVVWIFALCIDIPLRFTLPRTPSLLTPMCGANRMNRLASVIQIAPLSENNAIVCKKLSKYHTFRDVGDVTRVRSEASLASERNACQTAQLKHLQIQLPRSDEMHATILCVD